MFKRLKGLWPLFVLLALTLLFYGKLAFTDLILARGDTFSYFYPYWAVRSAAFAQGQLPLWTPDLFMGAPLLANSQIGVFYPPNWLLTALPPPDAVRMSILLHVFWALSGAYVLARAALAHEASRDWTNALPALTAAVLFGLGGFTGARVEQINQLQGIAWMPWLFWLYFRAVAQPTRGVLPLAMSIALQFFTGHTQTVFITLADLALAGLMGAMNAGHGRARLYEAARGFLILGAAALIALPLMVPQLIPTLELMSVSNRSGGLNQNQATAFSFNPLLIGRGLLPSYDGLVFTEFVAYPGIVGLGLALLALARRGQPSSQQRVPQRGIWVAMVVVGLALALGEFNPLYWALAALPGFNLFRVPARWLALFALGGALLAGLGLRAVLVGDLRPRWRTIGLVAGPILALGLSSLLSGRSPENVIGPAEPTFITWGGWGAALVILIALLLRHRRLGARLTAVLLTAAAALELLLAGLFLPHNHLVTPDTYHAQRFTISQLLAFQNQQAAPGRLLSISELLFDPGDRAVLEARYQRAGLSEIGLRLGLVDTKMKEVLAANLPLIWGIPTIDGFDGGLLPTRYYTAFTSLLLPPDELRTLDGRLREILAQEACRGACLPEQRWLNLTHTRYLVVDKVYDLWREGVAYDTQMQIMISPGSPYVATDLPDFEADALDLLYECPAPCPADLTIEVDVGEAPAAEILETAPLDRFQLQRVRLERALMPQTIEIRSSANVVIYALTLVDTRTGDFAPATLGPWRKLLSSDIKLYENKTVLERAFVIPAVQRVPDTDLGSEAALDIMRDPDFDPAQMLILADSAVESLQPVERYGSGSTRIEHYSPERVEIAVRAEQAGFVLLTDAFYPGWLAQVNDQPVPIFRADVMFRAVPIPPGDSRVVFEYRPFWYPGAVFFGGAVWLLAAAMLIVFWMRRALTLKRSLDLSPK